MTIETIKEHLTQSGYEDTVILTNPSYENAVIGITDNGQLIYKYELMIDHLMKIENMTEDEAIDYIDYNTMRSIPYMGEKKPIVVFPLF